MRGSTEEPYEQPRLDRFGTFRDLTRVGCTLGGDGLWICSSPDTQPTPPGNGERS